MKKILIIGANGFLSRYILQLRNKKELKDFNYKFIAADIVNNYIPINIPFYFIDITDAYDTKKKINKISPELIILTAAMTNVDQCEINKNIATKINTEGPKNILNICKKIGSKLVFISSDFVFDGTKNGLYNENDLPNPLSHYGKTKLEAEIAIRNSELNYLICRIAVLYGWNKEKLNFITWIINKLENNENIPIVTTQINSPTFVENLADILIKLIEKDATGIYHTAGDCVLSRYEMALKCAEVFNFDKDLIKPIKEFKQKAIRPRNAGLDIKKLKKLISSELKIYNLEDGLNHMKNHK